MYLKFLWRDLGGVCEREECCIPLSYYFLFKQQELLLGVLSRHAFFQRLWRCPELQQLVEFKGVVEGPFLKVKQKSIQVQIVFHSLSCLFLLLDEKMKLHLCVDAKQEALIVLLSVMLLETLTFSS